MKSATSLLALVLLSFGALFVLAALARLVSPRSAFVRKQFLTESEARVLTLLEQALPQQRIMAQVAMGALLRAGDADKKRAHSTRNRFAQKIVDFAVVTRDTAEVIALIELDDRTHKAEKDAQRDAMTRAAGYRTIRIPSRPRPDEASVRNAVSQLHVGTTANLQASGYGR